MLEQWILDKLEPLQSASMLILRDPQRMIQSGAQAVDGWAEAHGFSVFFCTGNLALREMYERVRDEAGLHALLIDRSRSGARNPLFYPDLEVKAGRRRQMTLTLRDFLMEKTGDAMWPQAVNDRNLSRWIITNLAGALRCHAQLRAVRPAGFADSDLHKIVLGAALDVNPFRQLTVPDVRRVAMQHHATLEELQRVLPPAAMEAWRSALAKVPKPFCWLLERDATLVVRSFTLAALLHQHGLDHRLLMSNLDPQLHAYREIDNSFLEGALRQQAAADPDRLAADVRAAEQFLQEADGALALLLRDQLGIDDPPHARKVLERESLSPFVRSMALFSLLADLLANRDLKFHRGVRKLLDDQDRRADIPALRRPDEAWLALVDVYGKAFAAIELVGRLAKAAKALLVTPDEELKLETFDDLWNKDGLNRLDYYLSDLERTLRIGAITPAPQRFLWAELDERWRNARSALAATMDAAVQAQHAVNLRFQRLYQRRYAQWIRREDAPVVFTHQFLPRLLKAHWDPQGKRKAVILIFDGMRTDAFAEFLLPVLQERYRVIASQPGSAILPTETHLSRKAIAAGALPEAFKAKRELDLLRHWLKETWNLNPRFEVLKDDDTIASGMTVRYQSDKLEYIIFNFSDRNLHNNAQDLAFIYDNIVRAIIRQDVRAVLRDLPDDALIFVTSDHGFSPVPPTPYKVDASWAAPEDVNYRVMRTHKQIPDAARSDLVDFDARTLGIPLMGEGGGGAAIHSVVFPRPGLTLQRPGSGFHPDPYTHGGLSMAECFVPMVVLGPPDAQPPLLRIERFVQTGSTREGETLTLELTLQPMRIGEGERVITMTFSRPEIAQRREIFPGSETLYTIAWTPQLGDVDEAERAAGEMRLPVTAVVAYQEGETTARVSRTLDVRIKLDTTRLRRRVDSKLDLLMGKVPKGLQ